MAVVKPCTDYTARNCLSNIVRQGRSNVMKCPDVEVACFADCRDVVERQVRVENDAESLNRRRWRYARTSNVDTFEVHRKSSLRDAELDSFGLEWFESEAVVRLPIVQRIVQRSIVFDSSGPLLFVGEM